MSWFVAMASTTEAQNGDQLLDGIGETGLLARYLFNGNLKDRSRNNLHAQFQGNGIRFENDRRFGKVLSLSGKDPAYLTLPGEVVNSLTSFSITGWIYLRSAEPGQRFFDFGTDASHDLFVAPVGTPGRQGCLTFLSEGNGTEKASVAVAMDTGKWVHLAIVLDLPSKTMITYLNGKPAAEIRDLVFNFSDVMGQTPGEKKLYIGKSLHAGDPNLNALLHDFRVYRVPLNNREVVAIRDHSQNNLNQGLVNTSQKRADDLPHFSPDTAQLYNAYLVRVSDVHVETTVGDLPRLPAYVNGTYRQIKHGPKVRVLWPSPVDNTAVRSPGEYIVTGRVAGTDFHPKARVTVKKSGQSVTPGQQLVVFPLDRVTLDKDSYGNPTKFIENRDKF
ncbi:MAG: Ig-like domain-containing protein, partial [Bacteroidota bacterium]|nr:Ig-like domain-containing protein [Bacteroidota bacterium]